MYHQWDEGKATFRFWGRFCQNCGCHANRKLPLTYNVIADPIFVRLAGNEDRQKISGEFEFRPDSTTSLELGALECLKNSTTSLELGALECLKNFLRPVGQSWILVRLDQSLEVSCPWAPKQFLIYLHFQTWISLRPVGQSSSNLFVASMWWGNGCIRSWVRLDQNWVVVATKGSK